MFPVLGVKLVNRVLPQRCLQEDVTVLVNKFLTSFILRKVMTCRKIVVIEILQIYTMSSQHYEGHWTSSAALYEICSLSRAGRQSRLRLSWAISKH